MTNQNFWDTSSIIEFGGGYGNMARIIRKMNPTVTYTLIDLPELLALQYIYLGSLESEKELNIVNIDNPDIVENKINFISSEFLVNENIKLDAESFISTWALTESPESLQKYITKLNFFDAKKLCLASHIDENNFLNNTLDFNKLKKEKVPFLNSLHEYWMK
jgi:hypothetical protein